MSAEPYIKVNMWMASADLSPAEILIFAVIHSYTMTGKDYHGGIQGLKSWTGCSERTIQRSLARLVSKEWIIAKTVSSGRNASVYVSNPVKMAGMNPVNLTPQPRQNDTVNPVNLTPNNTINNSINKNISTLPNNSSKLPTKAEVTNYAKKRRENGLKSADPDVFFDYYTQRNWQIYGKPINDWQALFDAWSAGKKCIGNRFNDVIRGDTDYSAEGLRKLGVSLGEEFYDDN